MIPSPFTISPLCDSFGAEVSGICLDTDVDRTVAHALASLLSRFQLLLFRGQKLTPRGQVYVCRSMGTVEVHRFRPGQLLDYPEIFRISNADGDGHTSVGQYWHCDGCAFTSPTQLVILNLVEAPSVSGETLFVDAYKALDVMPAELSEATLGVRWKHESGVWHPFHNRHFLSERNALLVNLGRIANVEGMDESVATTLTAQLDNHLSGLSTLYSHRWQAGDVILMDNCSVVHRAKAAPSSTRRVVHRSSVLELHSFLMESSLLSPLIPKHQYDKPTSLNWIGPKLI